MLKLVTKLFTVITSVLISANAHAHIDFSGRTLIQVPTGNPRGLVVIAPAKKYLMEEKLFTDLATKLNSLGFITVRFNWSPETLMTPGQELTKAAADINAITLAAQKEFNMDAAKTVLISKSFSTKALDTSVSLAKNHVLLTPNCSNEEPFAATYAKILNQKETAVSIFISNEDPYCDVHQIYNTIGSLGKTPRLFTTHGDHNFVTLEADAKPNYSFQNEVVNSIGSQINEEFMVPAETKPCITLTEAKNIVHQNLIRQSFYIGQDGILDTRLVDGLEFSAGAYSAADTQEYRTFSVQVSCTGEYSQYDRRDQD